MKRIIGIDADDCLIDTMRAFLDFYNQKYLTGFFVEDFRDFDLSKTFGINRLEVLEEERFFYKSHFYDKVQRIDGAYEALEYLSEEFENVVITARGVDVKEHLPKTISKLFDFHHFRDIYHVGGEGGINNRLQKWEVCKHLNSRLLIDDYHGHLLLAASNNIHGILMEKPWNKNVSDLPKCIYRARTWEEVLEIIEKKKEEIF